MVEKIFEEIIKEAKNGIIILKDEEFDIPVRMQFTFDDVDSNEFKLDVNDPIKFKKLLIEYVYCALDFYHLEPNKNNVKSILTYVWSNITSEEMRCVEDYLQRRISFFNNGFSRESISTNCDLGIISGNVEVQSMLQETPYCFKSSFKKGEDNYALPRISFGVENGICYIYAIQNKDSKENSNNPEYNELVHRTMRSINSGVKKYRNVTPSFVIALTYFVSFLKGNSIDKICVLSPLPLRQDNKKRVNKYILEHKTMKGNLDPESVEILKSELEEKRIRDVHNATIKFRDCFNRLKVHFSSIYLEYNTITNEMLLDVIELLTNQPFLQQIVADTQYSVLK